MSTQYRLACGSFPQSYRDRETETDYWLVGTTDEMAQRAKELQAAEQKVQITYSRPLWVSPATCDGGLSLICEIDAVEE